MTESVIAIFAWLGGACFCGLVPLGFAAILFFTARKRNQVGSAVRAARRTPISGLVPGPSLVRLQGRIAALDNAIDGSAENALVYLRLKVEVYESDSESSGWRGLTDKARGVPFQLDDNAGLVWINPDGLDKQVLGDGIIPNEDQIQAASILLGIQPKILRGQLRFRMWELRTGQTISVVGGVVQNQNGLVVLRIPGQPFIVSPDLGQALDAKISKQSKLARTWMLALGIPGAILFMCGVGGAIIALIRVLMSQ
jgi:hypothetical protein